METSYDVAAAVILKLRKSLTLQNKPILYTGIQCLLVLSKKCHLK